MTATFFIKNSPFRIPAGDRRKGAARTALPGEKIQAALPGTDSLGSLTCYFWAHKSPRRMLCCRQMEDRHTNIGGPPCPTMNGLSFYRKIPIFARGQGIFVSFHKEREKK